MRFGIQNSMFINCNQWFFLTCVNLILQHISPSIQNVNMNTTIYAALGENVTLHCIIEHNINARSVRWRRENTILSNWENTTLDNVNFIDNSRYVFRKVPEKKMFNLFISSINLTDFGEFICDWQSESRMKIKLVKLVLSETSSANLSKVTDLNVEATTQKILSETSSANLSKVTDLNVEATTQTNDRGQTEHTVDNGLFFRNNIHYVGYGAAVAAILLFCCIFHKKRISKSRKIKNRDKPKPTTEIGIEEVEYDEIDSV